MTKRRPYKLTRKGRLAVIYGSVNDIQRNNVGATMTQVARSMGLKPSTYILQCLKDLEKEGVLYHKLHDRRNGGIVKEWFITPPWEV